MTLFDEMALSRDAFLGGRVTLLQPRNGYRAGIDPLLLAAAVPARTGQSVLDLGCGAGAAILCLGKRVDGLTLFGLERQPEYADLAQQNAALNDLDLSVTCGDLAAPPRPLRELQFDHVIANPPYYRAGAHSSARDIGRAQSLGEDTKLALWIDTAARRLAPRGLLHVVQRTDRLPDLLSACHGRLGAIEVLPISSRLGHKPSLILLRARKSGRAAFQLHVPYVLHPGASHSLDGGAYCPEFEAILRNAAPLDWPGDEAGTFGKLTSC